MSGKAFGERFAIIPDSVLYAPISANAFRLFAVLQRHSDVMGHCYPGRNRLAEILRCSHDTVTRAKRELIDAGFITCVDRYDADGRRTTDDIFLHPPRRKDASTVRRTGASTNKEAVELEPEGTREVVNEPQKLSPPPTPDTLDDDTRKRGAEFMRAIRLGLPNPQEPVNDLVKALEPAVEVDLR
jgi:DNA-binding transcriptional MocR family regulator